MTSRARRAGLGLIKTNGQRRRQRTYYAAIDNHLARRLGQRREELGLTRTELDGLIGERSGTIAKFERGARRLGADHMFFLSRALDVPVTWFYEGLDGDQFRGAIELPPPVDHEEIDTILTAYYRIDNPQVRRDIVGLARAVAASPLSRRR